MLNSEDHSRRVPAAYLWIAALIAAVLLVVIVMVAEHMGDQSDQHQIDKITTQLNN